MRIFHHNYFLQSSQLFVLFKWNKHFEMNSYPISAISVNSSNSYHRKCRFSCKYITLHLNKLYNIVSRSLRCLYHMGLNARKPVFGGMQTTKVQTDQHLCFIPFWKVSYQNLIHAIFFNFLASLCSWGDWFETSFVRKLKERFCYIEAHIVWFLWMTINLFLGFVARNPVFWVSHQVRFKPACSATETSLKVRS